MFRAGQLHVTSSLPSQKCPIYLEENNPDLRIDPYMGTYFYRLNTNNPFLSDVKVRKALAYAISDECMEKHNWQTTQAGQVKDMEYNIEIFPRGFATGLRKLLGEVDE